MPQITRTFRVTAVQQQAGTTAADPVKGGASFAPVVEGATTPMALPMAGLMAGANAQPFSIGGLTTAEMADLAPNAEVTLMISWGEEPDDA